MKTIAVLSNKGGSSKTTLCINLAIAGALKGKKTAIIDLDPQASSSDWADNRESESPVVISSQPARLDKVLKAAEDAGADYVFIDSAPHSESSSLAAARIADFIIIPCRPAILDIRAIKNTIDLVVIADKKAAVVLSCVQARGGLADEAEQAILSYDIDLSPVRVTQRAAFVHSLTASQGVQEYEPKGKAAEEITALFKWLCKQVA